MQLGRERRRERYPTTDLITEHNDITWDTTSWPPFR